MKVTCDKSQVKRRGGSPCPPENVTSDMWQVKCRGGSPCPPEKGLLKCRDGTETSSTKREKSGSIVGAGYCPSLGIFNIYIFWHGMVYFFRCFLVSG